MGRENEEVGFSAFDNFPGDESSIPIEPGDILIQLNNIPFPRESKRFPPSVALENKGEQTTRLCRPAHALITHGVVQHWTTAKNIAYNQEVIHSTPDRFFKGVQRNQIEKICERDDLLGTTLAFRCTDPIIAKNIYKFAHIANQTKTPFAYEPSSARAKGDRRLETATANEVVYLDFFRAFRVYERLNQQAPAPISKTRGISCSHFVAYIFKASVIAKFFPEGVPSELKQLYENIETMRKQNDKKLDRVEQNVLKQFEEKAAFYLREAGAKDIHIWELQRPIKNANIKQFTYNALQSPLWAVGIYCFDNDKYEDTIISYDTYQQAYKKLSKPITR